MPLSSTLLLMAVLSATAEADKPAPKRPSEWAQPIKMEGVPNLHRVSDTLYRSAQPSAKGMQNLKTLGITTVVNLRSFHSDRDELGETGLGYEHIYVKAWHPEEKEAVRFLQIVTDRKRPPVLVHCKLGSDRTGVMCALYRVAVEGWTKKKALDEMTKGGFGFNQVWINLPGWLKDLDIDRIKKKAGFDKKRDPPQKVQTQANRDYSRD